MNHLTPPFAPASSLENTRLNYLDAVRAFALLLGIFFHASLSFTPFFMGWAVQDVSTSPWVSASILASHSFRMELFFLVAGYFSHMTFHLRGVYGFARTRFVRLVVPFVVGWLILKPLIVSGWIMGAASMRGDVDVLAGLQDGFKSLQALPTGIFTQSHLWFLYYLALTTAGTVVLRTALMAFPNVRNRLLPRADAVFAHGVSSWWFLPAVVVPTAVLLGRMRRWSVDTPDQSLIPELPVLLLYCGFFLFGWMLHRQPTLLTRFARPTIVGGLLAAGGIALTPWLAGFQSDIGHPRFALARVSFLLSYAAMMWTLISLTIGLFQRYCTRPSMIVRYLADSSYWLYLIHLPLVVWLQIAVAELPLPWWLKLPGVVLATAGIGLLTYDVLVRSTFLGTVLNGRKRPSVLLHAFTQKPALPLILAAPRRD